MRLPFQLIFLIVVLFFSSCNANKKLYQELAYFQDLPDSTENLKLEPVLIRSDDWLTIQVYSNSLNQEQVALFTANNSNGYLVDAQGFVQVPFLGKVKAAGYSRQQLAEQLTRQLQYFIKLPTVEVWIRSFKVNVLGEVRAPGVKEFVREQVTVIDAIAASGDLLESGDRNKVFLIRSDSLGKQRSYTINLKSTALFSSPAYYLQPNDLIYVGPNNLKFRTLQDPNKTFRYIQIAVSVVSVLGTLGIIFRR